MNKLLHQKIKESFTNKDFLRIVDLAKRRMIDYGIEEYDKADQKLFRKMREL